MPLVMRNDGAAVRLNNRLKGRIVEITRGNPAWQLVVPDAVVASKELTILGGKISNDISVRECKCAARRLSGVLEILE